MTEAEEKGYRKLIVWQKADELAFAVYFATKNFPKDEIYGLTSQLRRAAISVPTNIAEGMGRQNRSESRQFVNIALGSLAEAECLLSFCHRLDFLSQEEFGRLETLRKTVGSLLFGLHRSLK